jgi:glycosyltransferase involved in cell wall biosynthesis
MSHGLAVVAADSSSNPEAVGGTGLLFPPGDEASLAGALIRLIDEPGLRASLGAGARARFQERFTSATFQAATAAVYSQALRAPGPAAGGARA